MNNSRNRNEIIDSRNENINKRENSRRETCCNINVDNSPWIIHKNNLCVSDAYQVQLQDSSGGTLANGEKVLFDTIILDGAANSSITYNSITGEFTINKPGRYFVTWWVNTDGAEEQTNVIFSAEMGANAVMATSPSPLVTLQLNGQALFSVTSAETLSLINRSGSTVSYGLDSIQADLIIIRL